ncbi:hypothetical protein LTR27_011651 [Elasticomyces elasticus]|nr:hypothetical protein LTR27_011651 [Elasticomyces elasticus]
MLDEFWARATNLKVLKRGFYWLNKPWLAPQLTREVRRRMSHALGDERSPAKTHGTFCFGGSASAKHYPSSPWTLFLVFPSRDSDLIEDEKLAGKFHDQVLLTAYNASVTHSSMTHCSDWESMKNGPCRDLIEAPVLPSIVDIDRFWSLIQDGIDKDKAFLSLRVYTSSMNYGTTLSRDEAWDVEMEWNGKDIDPQCVVEDTIHTTFRDVTVASRRGKDPGYCGPFV